MYTTTTVKEENPLGNEALKSDKIENIATNTIFSFVTSLNQETDKSHRFRERNQPYRAGTNSKPVKIHKEVTK